MSTTATIPSTDAEWDEIEAYARGCVESKRAGRTNPYAGSPRLAQAYWRGINEQRAIDAEMRKEQMRAIGRAGTRAKR